MRSEDEFDGILSELNNILGIGDNASSGKSTPSSAAPQTPFSPPTSLKPSRSIIDESNDVYVNWTGSLDGLQEEPAAEADHTTHAEDDGLIYHQPDYVNFDHLGIPDESSEQGVGGVSNAIYQVPVVSIGRNPLPPPPPTQFTNNPRNSGSENTYLAMAPGNRSPGLMPHCPHEETYEEAAILAISSRSTEKQGSVTDGSNQQQEQSDYEDLERGVYMEPSELVVGAGTRPPAVQQSYSTPANSAMMFKPFSQFPQQTNSNYSPPRSSLMDSTRGLGRAMSSQESSMGPSSIRHTVGAPARSSVATGRVARLAQELPIPPVPGGHPYGSMPALHRKQEMEALNETNDGSMPNILETGLSSSQKQRESQLSIERGLSVSRKTSKEESKVSTLEEKKEFLKEQARLLSEKTHSKKVILNVFNVDESYKTLVIDSNLGARDVIEALLLKNNLPHSISWQLCEVLMDEGLDREIEDHENVSQVYENWPPQASNRLLFRQNFKKYEIFQNPSLYLPGFIEKRDEDKQKQKVDHAKDRLMREMFMSTDKIAELSGHLWIKEKRKKWRKVFCSLRKSGLYYSTRGASKDPKHWFLLINFAEVEFYNCYDEVKRKRIYQAPTPELIVFMRGSSPEPVKDRICICCLDRPNRLCWQQGIRLSKFGVEDVRRNFQIATNRHQNLKRLLSDTETGSIPSDKTKPQLPRTTGTVDTSKEETWFKGDMSPQGAEEALLSSSAYPGTFLVRSFDGKLYLSLIHGNKICHLEIKRVNVERTWLLTIEDGLRNFRTLKELIEFYRNEQSCLPVRLLRSVND